MPHWAKYLVKILHMARLRGIVDWYHADGYGVIRGATGVEYFARHVDLASNTGGMLRKGQRVTFRARPSKKKEGRMDALDVELADSVMLTTDRTQAALETAASEVLRARRARRESPAGAAPDIFAKGAIITHPEFGRGEVLLSTRITVSVAFDDGGIESFRRAELQAALAQSSTGSQLTSAATQISGFMDKLRRDTQIALSDEGLDSDGVYQVEPAREPRSSAQLDGLDPRIRDAFAEQGLTAFFSHQAESYAALKAGRNLVLCTPTASGKTASFTPAILESLLCDPGGAALFVFPLVALAADQTAKLLALNAALDSADQLRIGVLNSSVGDDEKRETMRARNDILVTTPDTLHYRLLPSSAANWSDFFARLRFIVLDEAHLYKGAFGSNVANIVRRAIARTYRLSGRAPKVVVASATVRDPRAVAAKLTGYKADTFTVVDQNGARSPRRHMLITRENTQDLCTELLDVNTRDAHTGKTRPVRVIVFTRSIQGARNGCARLREHLSKNGRAELSARIADYYSDKSDKNDTFARLRKGEIQCIYSTTALMAGIDIGSLDVVIVDGFPGLVMDARQMFGRAGRASEGAAIFVAHRGDPFDDFYLDNPDLLFRGVTEPVIANPDNPLLLNAHLLCAAHRGEGPLHVNALRLFGDDAPVAVSALEESGQLRVQGKSIHGVTPNPHDAWPLADLRATNDKLPLIVQTRDGRELERKRRAIAHRDTHPDAVFTHNGEKYRVTQFPKRGAPAPLIVCEALKTDPGYWTQGVETFTITIEKLLAQADPAQKPGAALGDARVLVDVNAYRTLRTRIAARCVSRRCRHESPNTALKRCPNCGAQMRVRQSDEADPNETPIPDEFDLSSVLDTQAAWIKITPEHKQRFETQFAARQKRDAAGKSRTELPGFATAVGSAMNAIVKAFPECANCDRDDVAAALEEHEGGARLYFYDQFPRGLGLAAEFALDPQAYLETALETVERCGCDDAGCPVCLQHFRLRQQGKLSKLGARYWLRTLMGLDVAPVLADLPS
jgi:DEAD/DEAH box helicase domain-containing protein